MGGFEGRAGQTRECRHLCICLHLRCRSSLGLRGICASAQLPSAPCISVVWQASGPHLMNETGICHLGNLSPDKQALCGWRLRFTSLPMCVSACSREHPWMPLPKALASRPCAAMAHGSRQLPYGCGIPAGRLSSSPPVVARLPSKVVVVMPASDCSVMQMAPPRPLLSREHRGDARAEYHVLRDGRGKEGTRPWRLRGGYEALQQCIRPFATIW